MKQLGKYFIVTVVGVVFWCVIGVVFIDCESGSSQPAASEYSQNSPARIPDAAAITQQFQARSHSSVSVEREWRQASTYSSSVAPHVAENGSYYGQLNDNGVPKTVYVRGYFRSDGTYVRSHYRSPPYSNPPYQQQYHRTTSTYRPHVAENGSYYGQLNNQGQPKRVYVQGYYRRDGTYVRGHYRSR